MALALIHPSKRAYSLAPLGLKEELQGFRVQGNRKGLGQEPLSKQFRQLRYEESTGPREVLRRLRELCRQWLQPETRSKEQILELLVLEQFLTILPRELLVRVLEHHPETGEDLVGILEDLQRDRGEAGQQKDPTQGNRQTVLVLPEREVRKPEPEVRAPEWEVKKPEQEVQKSEQEVRKPEQEVQKPEQEVQKPEREVRTPEREVKKPEREVRKPEKDKGKETRNGSGKLVIVTDHCGRIKSSCTTSKPMEAHSENLHFKKQPTMPKEKTSSQCLETKEGLVQHSALTEHERAHAGEKSRESVVCQSSVPTEQQEVLSKEKGHPCHECGKVFQRSSHLIRHQKIHLGEKPFKCKECGKVFSQNAGLLEHLRIHTGERPYLCIHCGKNFRRSSHLNRHQKIHSQEEPRQCKECGKTFSKALLLTHHQRIHGRAKRHYCNECGKGFSLTSDLIRHHRIHTGEKPFKCKVCQKAFRLNSHLDQHVRIHNEEKPYQCSECKEAFRQKSGLFQHQRHHHKSKLA
ncbi:zinc finger and SCAN domain-containing protein 26 [Peromyscus leucopus]|uniref:zinc finger and SCAN domain-containing protein 26 n=1 Tax=Peromyscus leucopus TaxID=10041 RepID=UPI0010A1681F|nr:zinc finger and SCAN domain-containing protein 26 [Peromyscus leucopus]XP_028735276.1 zinc finger and SCAN domain-containing protein 26 [Peromyscus leucopus]